MLITRIVTALAISLCVLAPSLALADPSRTHIDKTLVRFVAAFNNGEGATVASFYTEDAALLPPQAGRVDGPQCNPGFLAGCHRFWHEDRDAASHRSRGQRRSSI